MQFTDEEFELLKRADQYDLLDNDVYCRAKNPSNMLASIGPKRGIFWKDYFAAETPNGFPRYRLHAVYDRDTNDASDYFLTYLGMHKEREQTKAFRGTQSLVHLAYNKRSMFHDDHTPKNGFHRWGQPHALPEFIDPWQQGCNEICTFIMLCNRMRHFSYENAWLYSMAGTVDAHPLKHGVSSSYTLKRCKFDQDFEQDWFSPFVEELLSLNRGMAQPVKTLSDLVVKGLRIEIKIEANRCKPASKQVDDRSLYETAFANSIEYCKTLQSMPPSALLAVQMHLYTKKAPVCQSCLFYPFVVMRRAGLQPDTKHLMPKLHPYLITPNDAKVVDLCSDYDFMRLMRIMAPRPDLVEGAAQRPRRRQRRS